MLGCEVGGRWCSEAWKMLRLLAQAKTRAAPGPLQRSAELAWQRRWASVISVSAQRALAASLAEPSALDTAGGGDEQPELADLFEGRAEPPEVSRQAWR